MILSFSGRAMFSANVVVTPSTTETLLPMVVNRAGVVAQASTSIAPAAGKTLRIMNFAIVVRNLTAVAAGAVAQLRLNPTGVALLTSPVIASVGASATNAIINGVGQNSQRFSEGLELAGPAQISVTLLGVAAGSAYITLFGYEY